MWWTFKRFRSKRPRFDAKILDLALPILGLCYGHQLIAHLAGKKLTPEVKEYRVAYVKIEKLSRGCFYAQGEANLRFAVTPRSDPH
ncbi:MAG: glutamine amidotransferase-related protein [Archaeoglobaceae archaeon]